MRSIFLCVVTILLLAALFTACTDRNKVRLPASEATTDHRAESNIPTDRESTSDSESTEETIRPRRRDQERTR